MLLNAYCMTYEDLANGCTEITAFSLPPYLTAAVTPPSLLPPPSVAPPPQITAGSSPLLSTPLYPPLPSKFWGGPSQRSAVQSCPACHAVDHWLGGMPLG